MDTKHSNYEWDPGREVASIMSKASKPHMSSSTLPWYTYQPIPELPRRPWVARSRPPDVCTTYSSYNRTENQPPSGLRVPLSIYTSGLTHNDGLGYNGHLGPSISLPSSPRAPMEGLIRNPAVPSQPRSVNESYLGLFPAGNSMQSLVAPPTHILTSDQNPPFSGPDYSSRQALEYYNPTISARGPSSLQPPAFVRTIVRMHAYEPAPAAHQHPFMYSPAHQSRPNTTSPSPPALPARSRKHGAKRSATCVGSNPSAAPVSAGSVTSVGPRRFVPLLSPELFRRSCCLTSQPHSDPLRYPSEQMVQRAKRSAFNLESHLDCSCDYVRAGPGLWSASEWYERNFHTVDRCTCPHEEVHRYFDDAASTWKLADTIAMLPIRETDILDDLVDSTSEEEEEVVFVRPMVEDVTHQSRLVSGENNIREPVVSRISNQNEPIIVRNRIKMADFRMSTEEDDMMTLGQMLAKRGTLLEPKAERLNMGGGASPEKPDFRTVSQTPGSAAATAKMNTLLEQKPLNEIWKCDDILGSNAAPIPSKMSPRIQPKPTNRLEMATNNQVNGTGQSQHPDVGPTAGYEDIDQFNNEIDMLAQGSSPSLRSCLASDSLSAGKPEPCLPQSEKVLETVNQRNRDSQDILENGLPEQLTSTEPEDVVSETQEHPGETDTEMREAESDLDLNEWLAGSHDSSDSEYLPETFDHEPEETKLTPTPKRTTSQPGAEQLPDNHSEGHLHWNTMRATPEVLTTASQPSTVSSLTVSHSTIPRRQRSVRDEFEARQRALKRWALLSMHVSEMAVKVSEFVLGRSKFFFNS